MGDNTLLVLLGVCVGVGVGGCVETGESTDLTYNHNRRRNGLKALSEHARHKASVGGESLFRDHVSRTEEVLYHSEDKAAKKQEGMHLDLQQM